MNISIQSKGGTPIYEQIATQIKEAILAGKLNKDDALPSIRALSADIKVSVITTKKAYEELEKENPNHFAVRQYKKYKLAAGVVCSKRLLNQAVGKSLRKNVL